MKTLTKIIGDTAITVGCCLGVGFISGKEAQVFFGNKLNVALFAIVFFVATYAVREYCRKQNCATVQQLSQSLFARSFGVFNVVIALCSFVCITTVLAGAEQCVAQLFYLSKLPLYAFAVALFATLLLKAGMKALKIANTVSIVLAIVLFVVLLCKKSGDKVEIQVPAYQPVVYSLFSVTMSLGVLSKMASESNKKENLVSSLLSALILSALMLFVLPLCNMQISMPTLGSIDNPYLLVLAVVTLLLSAVTGVVANAYPVVDQLRTLIEDDTLCYALVFTSALAFSMFGFDFAVKFGYLLVSVVGAVIISVVARKLLLKSQLLHHRVGRHRQNKTHRS